MSKVESNETRLSIEKKTPLAASLEIASDDYELKKRAKGAVMITVTKNISLTVFTLECMTPSTLGVASLFTEAKQMD